MQARGGGGVGCRRGIAAPTMHDSTPPLPPGHLTPTPPPPTGARLLLPLRWVPDRLGAANWVLGEPPTGQGPWVDELGRQLELLRDRLAQVGWDGDPCPPRLCPLFARLVRVPGGARSHGCKPRWPLSSSSCSTHS